MDRTGLSTESNWFKRWKLQDFHSKMTEVSERYVHKEGIVTPSMGRIGPVRASANKTREAAAEHKHDQLQLAETLPRYTYKR